MNDRQIECFLEAGKAYYNLFQRTYLELDRTRQALSNTTPALRLGINKDWRMPDFLPPRHGALPPAQPEIPRHL